MAGSAVVLGGGGAVGLAWELGMLAGLAEGGVRLGSADWILGTSAGSFVGALLAAGLEPEEIERRQAERAAGGPDVEGAAGGAAGPSDPAKLMELFTLWSDAEALDVPTRRRIGTMAIELAEGRGHALRPFVTRVLDGISWPDRFEATAVDAESGDFVLFDRASGVSLVDAVTASCSVPGIFPPVEIDGRSFVDGGVRSGTSADVLLERAPERVVIVAPLAGAGATGLSLLLQRLLDMEAAGLRSAGIEVRAIVPDTADRAAFGPNMMDATRREPALEAGRTRGRREAAALAGFCDDSRTVARREG